MVFAVSDEEGNILGLYRMPDATYFSIGVAVAKARNIAYYDNPSQLQPIDKIKGVPAGTAFTSRTFRYVSLPFFPEGIDINPPGPGNILTDGGVTKFATNQGRSAARQRLPEHPGLQRLQSQYEFPRSVTTNGATRTALYSSPAARRCTRTRPAVGCGARSIGGLGVSGDGVFQDDDVTSVASIAYAPPPDYRPRRPGEGPRRPTAVLQVQPQPALAVTTGPSIPIAALQGSSRASSAEEARPISRREPMRPSLLRATLVVSILAAGGRRPRKIPLRSAPACGTVFTERERHLPASPDLIPHTDERAGYPRGLARHIEPSTTPGGIGYYVGGGVALGHGQARESRPGDLGLGRDRRSALAPPRHPGLVSAAASTRAEPARTAPMGTSPPTSSTAPPARSTAWAVAKGAKSTINATCCCRDPQQDYRANGSARKPKPITNETSMLRGYPRELEMPH